MVLVCNGNLLDLKKNHKLNCNKKNEILNTLVIDNNKIFKIKDLLLPSFNSDNSINSNNSTNTINSNNSINPSKR